MQSVCGTQSATWVPAREPSMSTLKRKPGSSEFTSHGPAGGGGSTLAMRKVGSSWAVAASAAEAPGGSKASESLTPVSTSVDGGSAGRR